MELALETLIDQAEQSGELDRMDEDARPSSADQSSAPDDATAPSAVIVKPSSPSISEEAATENADTVAARQQDTLGTSSGNDKLTMQTMTPDSPDPGNAFKSNDSGSTGNADAEAASLGGNDDHTEQAKPTGDSGSGVNIEKVSHSELKKTPVTMIEALEAAKSHNAFHKFQDKFGPYRAWDFGFLLGNPLQDLIDFHNFVKSIGEHPPYDLTAMMGYSSYSGYSGPSCTHDEAQQHEVANDAAQKSSSASSQDKNAMNSASTSTAEATLGQDGQVKSEAAAKVKAELQEADADAESATVGSLLQQEKNQQQPGSPDGDDPVHHDHDDNSEHEGEEEEEPCDDDVVNENTKPECSNVLPDHFFTQDGTLDMGNFHTNIAAYFVKIAREKMGDFRLSPLLPSNIVMGSLCSGSGAGEIAWKASVNAIAEEFLQPLHPSVSFCCEKEQWKQSWLTKNILPDSTTTCIFDDVVALGASDDADGEAMDAAETVSAESNSKKPRVESFCVQHNKKCLCQAQGTFILKSGFSCKGNSRMNVKFHEFQLAMKNPDHTSCSVATFYGTLGVINKVHPKIVVLENVDSIGSETKDDSNLQKVVSELESIDGGMYSVKVFTLSSHDYILPQRRTNVCLLVGPNDQSVNDSMV